MVKFIDFLMTDQRQKRVWKVGPEWPFVFFVSVMTAFYLGLLVLMVAANFLVVSWDEIGRVVTDQDILKAIRLSFVTSTATALLSVFVAVPMGYLFSRYQFRGKAFLDAVVDIPVLLPPLTVGLSLLLVFNQIPLSICLQVLAAGFGLAFVVAWRQQASRAVLWFLSGGLVVLSGVSLFFLTESSTPEAFLGMAGLPITFHPIAVVLAQFPVAAAFAIRMMRTSFDDINPRLDALAMTLGCRRGEAFFRVILPMSGRAVLAAGTMAWARALGEFGPILIFAGATRGRTEVLSTSVYLELSVGNVTGAAVLSLLMMVIAVGTIFAVRFLLEKGGVR